MNCYLQHRQGYCYEGVPPEVFQRLLEDEELAFSPEIRATVEWLLSQMT